MKRLKHGLHRSRVYKIWQGMKTRCLNERDPNYKRWGGKGVTICEEWLDFMGFYSWAIKNGYQDNLTIDRINNFVGYCPENCRWTTFLVQSRNKTTNKLNETMVAEIRKKLSLGVASKKLAVEYKCSPQNICDIKKNRIWKNIK